MGELGAARRWAAGAWVGLVVGGWAVTQVMEGGIEPTSGPRPAGHAPPSPTPITLPGACPSPEPRPPVPTAYPVPDPSSHGIDLQFTETFEATEATDAAEATGDAGVVSGDPGNCVVVTTR
ncbi:hypothetical protein AB0J38_34850 [Streptomyces sp. NPDC050095]|uniref:hypothetical protein n=1 Tax=Streptomyces sp. NPDC050095 TaxID=3155512 RepID=UPI003443FE86